MAVIRLFLLLVVLGCLTLLLMQNWSPVLALRFLGVQTQPLPLAIWILLGVVAGAITSLFITACFKLSNYFAQSQPRKRRKEVQASPPRSRTTRAEAPRSNPANYTTTTSQPKTNSTPSDDFNDWESNSSNDWNFEEDTQDTDKKQKPEPGDTVRDTNYETNTQPKSSERSSSYSYSYREPSNSGVGRAESVYDADYRVLTPPYRQTNTNENKNQNNDWGGDDWGFEDDEDWDIDDDKDSPHQQR